MADYYYSRIVDKTIDAADQHVRRALQEEGFGVLTEIDVQATFKKKLGIDYPVYRILGACNPELAHKALQVEEKIGTMLPCNVILQQTDGKTEVSAVDPVASMSAVKNEALQQIAADVRDRLRRVIDAL